MDNPTFAKIRDLLSQNNKIAIAVGQNSNLDTMAAVLSLVLALEKAGKQIIVASPTQPLVEVSSLVGIDKVKTDLNGNGGDLIVSFPYKEGEIEKVSYTLENGFLNIVVKAGKDGLTFSEDEIRYKRGGEAAKLLFVVGTPRLSDLGALFDTEALKDTTVINIDNSVQNQGFGDVVLVSPNFSSVSEQVATLLNSLPLEFGVDEAQNLLSGISFATNNFADPKTSTVAFEMVALLMKKGATRQALPKADFGGAYDPFFGPRPSFQQKQAQSQFPSKIEEVETEKMVEKKDEERKKEAPPDWLTPKIYKGSTLV